MARRARGSRPGRVERVGRLAVTKWIDVSVPIAEGMVEWPGSIPTRVERATDVHDGDACTVSSLTLCLHTGTHVDAPSHFLSDGLPVDAMALEAVLGPARVIEIQDPEAVGPQELRVHAIGPGERVLFRTRNSTRGWHLRRFSEDFVHVSPEAAQLLAQLGVRTVGIDHLSIGGFRDDLSTATHRILLEAGICIIEGLDLSAVSGGDYDLVCLPLRVEKGEAAPARVILRPSTIASS